MEVTKNRASFIYALIALAVSAALVLFTAAGCSSSAAATLSEPVDSDNATATVTAVDGDTITLSLGGASEQPGQGGEPPSKPQGSNEGDNAENGGSGGGNPPGEPPAMPDENSNAAPGDAPDNAPNGEQMQGNKPPSGDAPGGKMDDATEVTLAISDTSIIYTSVDGTQVQGSLDDIVEGATLVLSIEGGTNVTRIVVGESHEAGGGPNGTGSSNANFGSAAIEYSSDASTAGETYASANADENAVRSTNGATVSLASVSVEKTGDSSSSEDSDFYGLNAGILANDESNLTVAGGSIATDSSGSNGLFAYGEGTVVSVSDLVIRTTQGNSGGIEVAGGATLVASNLDIDTQGQSSAAIRSDRGGGTETVTGGTYTTHGAHSPAVYSTADVTVNDATLLSENCEGVVIEGENSVTLNNTTVTGNVNGAETQSGVVNNVMIYQSMSGDADEGTAQFEMNGGTFNATNGTLFYVTNTSAKISLSGVNINNSGDSLMTIAGQNRWGNEGKNGGNVTFKAASQALEGDITVDSISTLTFDLTQASSYSGAINADGQAGVVSVALEDGSTWTLTGDSYVSELSGDLNGIDLNGHTLYVNGQAWTGSGLSS